jgi:hypothetical protein
MCHRDLLTQAYKRRSDGLVWVRNGWLSRENVYVVRIVLAQFVAALRK